MSDILTSTYSNQSTGVREMSATIFEDVEGTIQNITPHVTPFISSIGKGKATNTYHEWLEDELTTPSSLAGVLEGADATSAAKTPPNRLGNYTQIIEDTFMVSGSMEAVNTIGRQSHAKYLLSKSLKELNMKMEYICINSTTNNAGAGATARTTKGMSGFVTTNDSSWSSYAETNDFSEAKLMAMAEDAYGNGGEPNTLLLGPAQARKIADWDQNSRITVNTNASEKTLVMAVMILETPFGRIKVTIDRYIAVVPDGGHDYNSIFLYDPTKMSIASLRPVKTTQLAKTGDSEKYQSLGEFAFVCHNEKAHAKCLKNATDAS